MHVCVGRGGGGLQERNRNSIMLIVILILSFIWIVFFLKLDVFVKSCRYLYLI